METINQAGLKIASRVARRVSTVIACFFALVAIGFLAWNSYFRVAAGVQAISGQLSHLLTVGDSFQLKTQLLSLSSSGIVDQFQLSEPGGTVLVGNGDKEGSQPDANMEIQGAVSFHIMPNGLHLLRRFEIPTASGQKSTLLVSKKLHLEIFFLVLLIQVLVFYLVHHTFRRLVLKFASELTNPISELATAVTETAGYEDLASNKRLRSSLRYSELNQTLDSFLKLLTRIQTEESLRIKAEKDATLAAVASQVAHDVRSPLAALNMALLSSDQISEEDRIILRSALQRINDIANELLSRSKSNDFDLRSLPAPRQSGLMAHDPIMLVAVVESLLREKRMQFRDKPNVEIKEEMSAGSDFFVRMAPSDLARVISNLINNSVEAFDGRQGLVTVALDRVGDMIRLLIRDNGKGMPKEILQRLGEKRVTHDKVGSDSGSGLGVRHARTMVENAGGKLYIESEIGIGTTVTLVFPKAVGIVPVVPINIESANQEL